MGGIEMSGWTEYCIKDIATLSNGINFDKTAYTKGVKIIGVSDFKERIFPGYDSLQEVDKNVVNENSYLHQGDIVFVRSNGNKELVGRCMLINKDMPLTFSGFCIRLRLNNNKSFDPIFLTYLFKSDMFRKSMSGTAVGANIQNLSQERLGNCRIKTPTLIIQQRIANILFRYDSLIENYQQQIQLLEEAAQRLYKEWFVDLRFPGHEESTIVDSIPEGWNRVSILQNDIFSLVKSRVPQFEGKKKYYATADVCGTQLLRHFEWVEYDSRPSRASIIPVKNSVWFARMSNSYKILNCFGENERLADEAIISSGFCGFTSKPEYYGFVYNTISSKYFDEEKNIHASGSTQISLTNEGLKMINIILPSVDLIVRYSYIVRPMMLKVEKLRTLNNILTEARDRLLPKLMSGEIEV